MSTPLEISVAIAVSLLTLWLALLVLLVIARPRGLDLAEARRFVPDVIRLVRRIAGDPAVGRSVRWRLLLLLVYLASPVDLVPDFVPLLGYADDVIVLATVLRSVARRAGGATLDAHWSGSPQGLEMVRRLAGASKP